MNNKSNTRMAAAAATATTTATVANARVMRARPADRRTKSAGVADGRDVATRLERNFFVGDGDEAQALIRQGLAKLYAHLDAVDNFTRAHGADLVSRFGDGRVHALAYEMEPEEARGNRPPARPGLQWIGREHNPDGLHYDLYQPDKRTPEGLAIAGQARAIEPFNFSTWVLIKLGLPEAGADPLAPVSYAGTKEQKLLVSIAGTYPVPAWLRPVCRAEFNKLMGADR